MTVEIAARLFEALASRDDQTVCSLCSPDLRVIQNGARPMGLKSLLAFNHAVSRVLRDVRYTNAIRSATETGFVEEHQLTGILPDGQAFSLPICVVAEVKNGKIVEVREYFDSGAAAGLVAALG